MSAWQIGVIALGLIGSAALYLWLWELAIPATVDSKWFSAIFLGLVVCPGLFAGGLVYGVWKLGNRGKT